MNGASQVKPDAYSIAGLKKIFFKKNSFRKAKQQVFSNYFL